MIIPTKLHSPKDTDLNDISSIQTWNNLELRHTDKTIYLNLGPTVAT